MQSHDDLGRRNQRRDEGVRPHRLQRNGAGEVRRRSRRRPPKLPPAQALNPGQDAASTAQRHQERQRHEREPHLPRWRTSRGIRLSVGIVPGRAGRGRDPDRADAHGDESARSLRGSGRSRAERRCLRTRRPPSQTRERSSARSRAWNDCFGHGVPGSYDVESPRRASAPSRLSMGLDPSRPVRPAADTATARRDERSARSRSCRSCSRPIGLDPVQAGGGGSGKQRPDRAEAFRRWWRVGVQMASGDVSFMGLGTVTHVEGTKLCGFGHPMMEAGVTAHADRHRASSLGSSRAINTRPRSARRLARSARWFRIDRAPSSSTRRRRRPCFGCPSRHPWCGRDPKKQWNVDIAKSVS